MAAVAYTSTLAESDFYESEREREYRHISEVPELERQEIYDIYQDKGFRGVLLERIVDTITANRDVWVAVMMAEEHQLSPVNRQHRAGGRFFRNRRIINSTAAFCLSFG